MKELNIRTILPQDNPYLAKIIRDTLEEFNANKPGTVYYDEETNRLSVIFAATQNSIYYVAEENGKVIGGGGIFPTSGLPNGTCELVKLYLHQSARGKGVGKKLLEKCISAAGKMGYKSIYLETMPELTIAIPLYERSGFTYLAGPKGNSGHTGCDVWMIKELGEKAS